LRHSFFWASALLGAAFVSACVSDLVLSLEGKQCRPVAPPCLDGYECVDDICIQASLVGEGGATAGLGASGRSSGVDGRGHGGSAGIATGGGGSSNGGAPELLFDSGDGFSGPVVVVIEPPDATAPDVGVEAGCTAVPMFPDNDNDGVGVTGPSTLLCPPVEGWSPVPGDCRDDLPNVHLGQTTFFGEPFEDPTKTPPLSFDYDCSTVEFPDPRNEAPAAPPNCSGLIGNLNCGGRGYLPGSPARSGAGIEPRCGSNLLRSCVSPSALACAPYDVAVLEPFRCR
jgi:hypothetical protein